MTVRNITFIIYPVSLLQVCLDMIFQIAFRSKTHVTLLTRVRAHTCMLPQMAQHITLLAEGFFATCKGTAEWFFLLMYGYLMLLHRNSLRKNLITQVAGINVFGLALKIHEGTLAILGNSVLVLDIDYLENTFGCHLYYNY